MEIGLSLACFYPSHPEDMILKARELGFKTSELFINTFSELDESYIEDFKKRCFQNDLNIYSIHPFTSALENYMFFSPYDRRINDSKWLYEKYCVVAKMLGAKVINLHGDRGIGLADFGLYLKCLEPLIDISDKYGVVISHENVFFNSINHPEFIYKLKKYFGKEIKFTFDIKQAHKGGSDPYEVCEAMGENIINFHINDYDDNHICMLPGEGSVDFKKIFTILKNSGYSGPALIEVYSSNYEDFSQITKSANYLRELKY